MPVTEFECIINILLQISINFITLVKKYLKQNQIANYPSLPALQSLTWSMKTSNNISRSLGPAMCSGWNCMLQWILKITANCSDTIQSMSRTIFQFYSYFGTQLELMILSYWSNKWLSRKSPIACCTLCETANNSTQATNISITYNNAS